MNKLNVGNGNHNTRSDTAKQPHDLGVSSEVYGAVAMGRKGVGIELKDSYFKQAVYNMKSCKELTGFEKPVELFDTVD